MTEIQVLRLRQTGWVGGGKEQLHACSMGSRLPPSPAHIAWVPSLCKMGLAAVSLTADWRI